MHKKHVEILNSRVASVIAALKDDAASAKQEFVGLQRFTFPKQLGVPDTCELLVGKLFIDRELKYSSEPQQIQLVGLRQGSRTTWHQRSLLSRGELGDSISVYGNSNKPNSMFAIFQTSNSRTGGGIEIVRWDLEKHRSELLVAAYGEQDALNPSFSIRRRKGNATLVIYGINPPANRLASARKKRAEELGVAVEFVHNGGLD
ncbi:MAG: hypothetical protein CMJ78_14290 [Planctomycetaceae bacterium]|nr:hypothetical protein [Planctomycetaceae bacterium]